MAKALPFGKKNFFHGSNYPSWQNVFTSWLNVATPLWANCEGEAHTPKSEKLESYRIPEKLRA
jgi:hypothetical protein